MIKEAVKILRARDLSTLETEQVMEEIMGGESEVADVVSFLTQLSNRGETPDELLAAVKVMRRHATRIKTKQKVLLDTCGTGGDKKGTFNISTAVAFVVGGSGVAVAKHGNRSVSSKCGSADILEALGINIKMTPDKIQECLDKIGIAFLFAQSLHPAMKYAMPARKQIARRTIFNLIGPLSNPAGATHQLIGVFGKEWTRSFAEVLAKLGTRHALVVAGKDGLDEITTTDSTEVSEENNGKITDYEIAPEDFGIKKAKISDLAGGDASLNAKILLDLLEGKSGPVRDIVLLNAAAGLYAADQAGSIKEGIGIARDSIDSKKALNKLNLLKEYSNT
ncbi:MAG: anthranilate phosphoribosyltransferase [Candidatus Omnitrophica bacterium]|nr:anthranilate phosphoribosyltransferase [Candidatus Omnitrophota bacterium]